MVVEVFGGSCDASVVLVYASDDDFEGGDANRPNYAVGVVTSFDGRGDDTIYSDAIAAHCTGFFGAVLIEEFCGELGTVLFSEFEDLSNFDAFSEEEFFAVMSIAFDGVSQVGYDDVFAVEREIPAGGDIYEVVVGFICAGDTDGHGGNGIVDEEVIEFFCQTYRTGETDFGIGDAVYSQLIGKFDVSAAKGLGKFFFVDVVVAANKDSYRFSVCGVDEGFYHLVRIRIEELADGLNGTDVWGVHRLSGWDWCGGFLFWQRVDGGFLEVCGVGAVFGVDDSIFSVFAGDRELMGAGAAHFAGFCFDDDVIQAAPFEDSTISIVHSIVCLVEAFVVGVEAVCVFHNELTRADYAETWAEFVAKFRTYLVDVNGELFIGFYLTGGESGDDLFGGGSKDVDFAVAVLEGKHCWAIVEVSSCFVPELHRLEGGHKDFLCAGSVHFIADDVDNLAEGAKAKWQIGVGSAGEFSHQASAEHQLVTWDFGIGRDLLDGWNEHFGVSHNRSFCFVQCIRS